MSYGDLYDQIPLAWGIVGAGIAVAVLSAALIWS
jgi:hypothetical protein